MTDISLEAVQEIEIILLKAGFIYPAKVLRELRAALDAAEGRVTVKPLTFNEIVSIIETTEVAEMTEAGDRRWTRRMAEMLQRKQFSVPVPAPSDKIAEAAQLKAISLALAKITGRDADDEAALDRLAAEIRSMRALGGKDE